MTDWTARVIELEDAKSAMIAAKKQIKAEEERKALRAAREAIEARTEEIEHSFAKRLALANSEGMPQALIRKEVLRTNDWGTWVKWRDLAEIEPERVVVRNAKAEREAAENAPFVWDFENRTLTVRIDRKGVRLSNPWVLTDFTYDRYGGMYRYKGDADRFEGLRISDEIERAVNAGEIEVEEGVYS